MKKSQNLEIMNPLEMNQRVLTWVCGLPSNESTDKWKKIARIVFTFSVIIGYVCSLAASTAFIYKNVSIDLEESLFSLFHNFGAANMLYLSIATVIFCRELANIFEGLSIIYKESK